MKLSASLITFALLAPTSLAAPYLPACSSTSPTPCSCPHGTSYSESVTFAVIGATAEDVGALINDFYKCSWLGVTPYATQGPDDEPGISIRTSNLPTLVGTYSVTEKLTERRISREGSFVQKFEQLPSTVPVEYTSGNGSFSGYWVTLQGVHVFQYETAIIFSIYSCATGHPINFAAFQQSALNNATNILQAEGKIQGTNVKPYSIQAW